MDVLSVGDSRLTPEYVEARRSAWAVIVVYGMIVPCAYGALLYSAREAIQMGQPTPLSDALAFLHDGYRPNYYWWEIVGKSAPPRPPADPAAIKTRPTV